VDFTFQDPGVIAALWPKHLPLVYLGGKDSRWCFLAVSFSRVSFEVFTKRTIEPRNDCSLASPLNQGYIGVLSYDDLEKLTTVSLPSGSESVSSLLDGGAPSIIYRAHQVLAFDMKNRKVWLTERETGAAEFELDQTELEQIWKKALELQGGKKRSNLSWPIVSLEKQESDKDYLETVGAAINDIRRGRYYQINLLRYFDVVGVDNPRDLLPRYNVLAGPYGAWLEAPQTSVISFSPEQFVAIEMGSKGWQIVCSPIKGTRRRSEDPVEDRRLAFELQTSRKDLAELHMIVDLQRNDLARVCEPGSVQVRSSGALQSFATVHHLVGCVAGRLSRTISVGELLSALCPSGSITGAPKLEVMGAIKEYENRRRGYFMGNAFYLDDRGNFDSSVLIRTVVVSDLKHFEFAAGSGIVLESDANEELNEVITKTKVITSL